MAEVATYADVVRRVMGRIADLLKTIRKPDVETVLIEDVAGEHFLIKRLGWHAGRRVNTTAAHVRLKGEKVWIEEDGTEEGIATDLLAAGVPKGDIVLGFQPPESRHLTEFSAA